MGLTTGAKHTVNIKTCCTSPGILTPKTTTIPAIAVGNQQIPNKEITINNVFAMCTSSPRISRLLVPCMLSLSWLLLSSPSVLTNRAIYSNITSYYDDDISVQ